MTIDIQSELGYFQFSPETEIIYLNGSVAPRSEYEPVFMNHVDTSIPPSLSGILIVKQNRIISMSGHVNKLIDPNQINIK